MSDRNATLLVVAGEASGDLHGSKLVARFRSLAPNVAVYGVGGERMRAAGVETVYASEDFAVVGFVEVLRHVPRLKRAMDHLTRLVRERGTRVAVLIDYPGFNLALARRLKALGVRVLYYVSPQVWAWGEGRVAKIARRVDRMAVVFAFEKDFYEERGVDSVFVGHPLLEEPGLAVAPPPKDDIGDPPRLTLLPGSRRQEVARHLPPMLGAVDLLRRGIDRLDVSLVCAEGIDLSELVGMDALEAAGVSVRAPELRHDLMRDSSALLVSSGTATLEAACLGTPMVVLYRMSPLSYLIARTVVRIPDIALVNVVAGRRIVPELVQREVTPERLARETLPYLTDRELVRNLSRQLLEVRESLGAAGASERVARIALDMMGGD